MRWRYVKIELAYALAVAGREIFLREGGVAFLPLPGSVAVEAVGLGLMGVGVVAGLAVIQQGLNSLLI